MVNQHLAGVRFVEADLLVMPLKVLKALCVQHRVLPKLAVERADFVRALTPLKGVPAPGGIDADTSKTAPPKQRNDAAAPVAGNGSVHISANKPRKDFSKF